jgi:Luciferase-like monooxygenase
VALSFAAAATRTLKLGTGIALIPQRDPIITAKSVASLDQLSGDRRVDRQRMEAMARAKIMALIRRGTTGR